MSKIGVIGAGSWGSALASLLAKDEKNEVILWAYEPEVVQGIVQNHQNPLYLSDCKLSGRLKASNDLKEVAKGADFLVNVVPSHLTRGVWEKLAPEVGKNCVMVNASKGFEFSSHKRLSQVLMEVLPKFEKGQFVVLSGPSFAKEVMQEKPTTVVIAGSDVDVMTKVQKLFRRDWFLTYLNDDVIGVETGGAVKNVIAIASGLCEGMNLGLNTRAALITRGLYEMAKLGKVLGANPITFVGLSGIGDLVLTCTGELSRNRLVGFRLGQGESLDKILKEMKVVAEGVKSAKVVYELMEKHRLYNPVCAEIYKILYEKKSPSQALKYLLSIELKEELAGLL